MEVSPNQGHLKKGFSPGIVDPGEAIGEKETSPHQGPPEQGED